MISLVFNSKLDRSISISSKKTRYNPEDFSAIQILILDHADAGL
jgi:hypothetical protein